MKMSYSDLNNHNPPAPNWFVIIMMIIIGGAMLYGSFVFLEYVSLTFALY